MRKQQNCAYRSPWLSEEEICDRLWEDDAALLDETALGHGTWLREHEIANGLIPDFIQIGKSPDFEASTTEKILSQPSIYVVEVKITADIYSIAQLVTYANLLKFHGNLWASKNKSPRRPEITMAIFARYFDKSAIPFIENQDLDILPYRVLVKNDKSIEVEPEMNELPFRSHERFDRQLEKNLISEARKCQE